jgi:predicted MPP superfamily phosphohydrolase
MIKINSAQEKFLLKLIKEGKTRDECKSRFQRQFKRDISYEKLRQIAVKFGKSFKANTGHFDEAKRIFIQSLIKKGMSQSECRAAFKEKFHSIIASETLRRQAVLAGHPFSGKHKNEFSEDEISILRGALLLKKRPTQLRNELSSRNASSIESKMKKLRADGVVGDDVRSSIVKDIRSGKTNEQLAKKYGISVKYLNEFRREHVVRSQVEIENLKRWEEADVNEVLDLIETAQEKLNKISSEQAEANIKITTNNKYVALAFISDIHLENVNTDIRQLRQDIDTIRNTKDFYVGFGGDLVDNFMVGPHKEGTVEAVVPPKAARIAAGKLFDSMKGRVLWTIIGCHDAWDANYADYNLPEHIARKLRAPYLGHGGDINLTLQRNGSNKIARYSLHARHKYRGSSSGNGTAPCKRILTDKDPKFDIVAISHNHFAEIKIEHFLGKNRCFIRTGSYKKEDRYSKQLGYDSNDFNAKIPVVILNTENKEMKIVSGISNAADMLKALNKTK